MQYLVSVIEEKSGSEIDDGSGSVTPTEMAAIDAFDDRLRAEGHWLFAGGLAAPSAATVVDNRGGRALLTDGPYLEAEEYIIGFWVVEAPDLDVVLTLAAQGSKACNAKVEVRPLL